MEDACGVNSIQGGIKWRQKCRLGARMDNETDNLMDKDDRAYSCCNCGIDCGAFPEVWISLGGEVAIHSCFCSG